MYNNYLNAYNLQNQKNSFVKTCFQYSNESGPHRIISPANVELGYGSHKVFMKKQPTVEPGRGYLLVDYRKKKAEDKEKLYEGWEHGNKKENKGQETRKQCAYALAQIKKSPRNKKQVYIYDKQSFLIEYVCGNNPFMNMKRQ